MTTALEQLADKGYLVLPGVLSGNDLEEVRATVDELLAREKQHPFEPEDGPPSSGDSEIEKFFLRQLYREPGGARQVDASRPAHARREFRDALACAAEPGHQDVPPSADPFRSG